MLCYITKYATTKGIIRIEITEEEWKSSRSDEKYFIKKHWFLRKNVDVFLSEKEAIEDFEARKKKKLVSLKKQIAKLEKMQTKFIDESKLYGMIHYDTKKLYKHCCKAPDK